jgi:hypothetical protein
MPCEACTPGALVGSSAQTRRYCVSVIPIFVEFIVRLEVPAKCTCMEARGQTRARREQAAAVRHVALRVRRVYSAPIATARPIHTSTNTMFVNAKPLAVMCTTCSPV